MTPPNMAPVDEPSSLRACGPLSSPEKYVKKYVISNKGGTFLQKLWSCVCWGVLQDNLALSTELVMWVGHHKEILKLTYQVLTLPSERI